MTNFIAKIDAAVACLDSLSSRLDNCERMDAQARIDAEKKRDPTDEYLEERRFDPESGGYEDSDSPSFDELKRLKRLGLPNPATGKGVTGAELAQAERESIGNAKVSVKSLTPRKDSGERTVKKAAYQQKIKEGVWEVEYEPDSHGRATIIKKRTGERETLRVVD